MKTYEAGSSHGFFPKVCIFCSQYRKTVRRKSHNAYKILPKEAEQNIKHAADVKNDLPLLCQIQDVDLTTKELMIHKKYYLDYTLILGPAVEKATEQFLRQFRDFSIICIVLDTDKKIKKYIEINSKQEFLTNMVFL